jgi:hypothetical protein
VRAALTDPNPVLIFGRIMLYNLEGDLDPKIEAVDISSAKVRSVIGARVPVARLRRIGAEPSALPRDTHFDAWDVAFVRFVLSCVECYPDMNCVQSDAVAVQRCKGASG